MANVSGHPGMQYGGTRSTGKGLAIAALAIGVVALIASVVPLAGWVLGAIALVLGIVSRRQTKTGLGLAGLILGAVALVISTAFFVVNLSNYA